MPSSTANQLMFLRAITLALITVCLLLKPGLVLAVEQQDDQRLQQRQLYTDALNYFQNGSMQRFNKALNQLHDYPLLPYLEYKILNKQIKPAKFVQIKAFLEQYRDTPIADKLLNRVLLKLATRKQWDAFLQFYTPQNSAVLQCYYLRALDEQGFTEAAMMQVPELWLSDNSQPAQCDYIFEKYKQAGLLTNDMVWQRLKLIMSKGRIRLARFVARDMTESEQTWVNMWIETHRHPQRLVDNVLFKTPHPMAYPIMTHGIKRLSSRNPNEAIKLLNKIKQRYGLPYDNELDIFRTIGLALTNRHDELADEWLSKIPDEHADTDVLERRIQNAIRHENWSTVSQLIDNLPVSAQSKLRWQFWWAYAKQRNGFIIESEETFKRLAGKRDYYGFLAADIMALPYQFENSPIDVNEQQVNAVLDNKGIQRAYELYQLNQIANARREWNTAIKAFDDDHLLAAAKQAYNWGWYDRAIAAIGQTEDLNDIEIRFPLAYKDVIDNYSNLSDLNTAWTYAIIRRESLFIKDARSARGALGLMQILPRTAKAVARSTNTYYQGRQQLIKTSHNIKLGTSYLSQMFKKHNNQTVLATAAYNAGPGNVKNWLPETKPMDAIRWIESIPFRETREYVTNVLAYKIIYEHVLGTESKTQLSQILLPVPARI